MVYVVDDDPLVCEAITEILSRHGHAVSQFPTAEGFLDAYIREPTAPACLLLDMRLPGMSGLSLQQRLQRDGFRIPIIFLTSLVETPSVVQAIQSGAIDFLEKPVSEETLVPEVRRALDLDAEAMYEEERRRLIRERLSALTEREKETMGLLAEGMEVKVIAATLRIGYQTAAKHRAAVLSKVRVRNEVELVQLLGSIAEPQPPEPAAVRTTRVVRLP